VARAIVRESERTHGPVSLTLAHLDPTYVRRRFPTIAAVCRRIGLDIAVDPIPVGPAAHYLMGGIDTDLWARTSLPGLFAAGETACTGVHGANRLASNSLLEGLVFGARAAEAMQRPTQPDALKSDRQQMAPCTPADTLNVPVSRLNAPRIRELMWQSAGLFRTRNRLELAVGELGAAYQAACREIAQRRVNGATSWRRLNLLTVAWRIAHAALAREESRGAHFRDDFPAKDDLHWRVHLVEARPHD